MFLAGCPCCGSPAPCIACRPNSVDGCGTAMDTALWAPTINGNVVTYSAGAMVNWTTPVPPAILASCYGEWTGTGTVSPTVTFGLTPNSTYSGPNPIYTDVEGAGDSVCPQCRIYAQLNASFSTPFGDLWFTYRCKPFRDMNVPCGETSGPISFGAWEYGGSGYGFHPGAGGACAASILSWLSSLVMGGHVSYNACGYGTGSMQADNAAFLAGGFVTGPGGLLLTKVSIHQVGGLGSPLTYGFRSGPTNAPRVRILNDSGDTPNPAAVVATLTLPSSWSGSVWEWTHSGLSLAANMTYWVELSCPGTQTARWSWDGYPNGSVDECYFLRSRSLNSGVDWYPGHDNVRFLFDLN